MSSWLQRKLNSLEQYTIDIHNGRREGIRIILFAAFLQALSHLWSIGAQLKFWLYRHRIFLHDQPLGCLVVVVGNLTTGGTGKTPIVEMFARALRDRGRKVAILSRGYKSKSLPLWRQWWNALTGQPETPPRVVSDGQKVLLDSELSGDEPYMLARNLPGVVVLVDKNRVKSGTFAIKKFGCDTLILDDGFQYLRLKGQLNLLLVDKTNPFGNGFLLPRGVLREPIKHLRRASYVFLTKSNGRRDVELEETIQRYNPGVDVIECAHRPQYLGRFGSDERQPLTYLRNKRVGVFSGIATPESFEKLVKELGGNIVFNRRFLDHYRFAYDDFVALFSTALEKKVEFLVITEKDAVRLPEGMPCPVPVYYLRLEVEIIRGAADFDEAVGRICFAPGQADPLVS